MEKITTIKMSKRTVFGKAVRSLRRAGKLPAIVYCSSSDPVAVELEFRPFQYLLTRYGHSGLFELNIGDDQPVKAFIQSLAYDAQTDAVIHVDFCTVSKDEKMTIEIPARFVGESLAIKDRGDVLVQHINNIKIECLPDNLIHEIVFDLSSLAPLADSIHLKDFNIPANIHVLISLDTVVATIEKVKAEKADSVIAKTEKDAIADIKVVVKDKKVKDVEAKT